MDRKIAETTIEHLGQEAGEYELTLFRDACWQLVSDFEMDEDSAIESVWNDGDFMPRVAEILGLDLSKAGAQ